VSLRHITTPNLFGFHNRLSCGIVISVPLGRVPEALPGFMPPAARVRLLLGVFSFPSFPYFPALEMSRHEPCLFCIAEILNAS
jgi:hypothetical protein